MLGILMNVVRQAAMPTLARLFVNAATSAAGAALGGAVVGGAVYAAKGHVNLSSENGAASALIAVLGWRQHYR